MAMGRSVADLNHTALMKLWNKGRVGYHLAMAVMAEGGERREQILNLMTESERDAAREVMQRR